MVAVEAEHGRPIVDGQHPHDSLWNSLRFTIPSHGQSTPLTLLRAHGRSSYGPVAYPTASASEDLLLRSVTISRIRRILRAMSSLWPDVSEGRIEASGFHGREPDEHRWKSILQGRLLATVSPCARRTGRAISIAQLTAGAIAPEEDIRRHDASIMYNRTAHGDGLLCFVGTNQSC